MKKHETKKHPRGASAGRSVVRDWQPLFARLRDAIDWALDVVKQLARNYDEEIEAIERTRGYLHAWLDGRTVDVDLDDICTTLAILFAAIEIDLGIDSSPLLAPLRTFPAHLHLPGAERDERPTATILRFPSRRTGMAVTQLAA